MNRKHLVLCLAAAAGIAPPLAQAAESVVDRARVVSVRPIVERLPVSREECWNDRQRVYEERRITRTDTGAPIGPGTVLGAVIGGVVGHQMGGSDRARDAATVGGAVVGGLIGNRVENPGVPRERVVEVERYPTDRVVQRCRVVNEVREATLGYDVRYEYAGQEFTTRLDRDPGRNLRVRVDIVPIEGEEIGRPAPGPRPPAYAR